MTEILRQPGRVANGLSTITARLTAQNDEYIASITGGMGTIDKNTGELRSTFDVLQDLSKAWGNLTSVEKQELTEVVAGKTQRSLFTAIMSNFSTAVGATEVALNSEGSALEENNKRMNSLNGKLTQLQSAWQSFARNTINSEVVKSLLSLSTNLIKLADTDFVRFLATLTLVTTGLKLANKGYLSLTSTIIENGRALYQVALQASGVSKAEALMSASTLGLTGSIKILATGIKDLIASSAPLLTLFGAVAAVVAGFKIGTELAGGSVEDLTKKTEDSIQSYEKSTSQVSQYKSQIESLNKQIDELKSKGSLTLTEKEDLDNLKEEKALLEANLKLTEQIAAAEKQTVQQDIISQLNFTSGSLTDFFNLSDTEKALKKTKELLKDAGNDIYKTFSYNGENIQLETSDIIKGYNALADEIKNSETKIANSSSLTQKEAEKEKERLTELKSAQSVLSSQMTSNVKTFSEWYQTLAGGGEEAESYRTVILSFIEEIDQALGTDFSETLKSTKDKTDSLGESINNSITYYNNFKTALDSNIESMVNYGDQLDILNTAMSEIKNTGSITAETFQKLSENNLLEYLDSVNGKLVVNKDSFINSTEAIKEDAIANLQASTAEQVREIVLEDLKKQQEGVNIATENANSTLAELKQWAISTGAELINLTGDAEKTKEALRGLAGDAYYEASDDAQDRINKVLENAKKTYNFISNWKPSSSKTATKSTTTKKSTTKEEYKAEIDTLYKYENALDNAKEEVDKLSDAVGNTDNYDEQVKYINQLIEALNNQIAKTNDLKNAQANQIRDYINQLRNQGFAIDYNADKNELLINNMEHLADFSGDTAKSLEKIINKIQSLNDNNRTLDSSVRSLTSNVKKYYDQLADIPEEKLKKFNELMDDFQQSQLDAVQDQITDLEEAMKKDPRLEALEKQIEALEKQNDTIDKQKEMEEKLLAVEEARQKLENARKQKTLQVYSEEARRLDLGE